MRFFYARTGLNLYLDNWKKIWDRRGFDTIQDTWQLIKFYPEWRRTYRKGWSGTHLLNESQPWMSLGAISFLKKVISKKYKVFEYGTGGSTMFFSKRADSVVSIEHDFEWFQTVIEKIQETKFSNIDAKLIVPDRKIAVTSTEAENYKLSKSSNGLNMYNYVHSIDKYPDCYFDLVSIDGRARPSCIESSISKVKSGKYLLLDNSERTHYQLAINDLLKEWQRFTFDGPTPYLPWFTQTSIWQKPL